MRLISGCDSGWETEMNGSVLLVSSYDICAFVKLTSNESVRVTGSSP